MIEIEDFGKDLPSDEELKRAVEVARSSNVPDTLWKLFTIPVKELPIDAREKEKELWLKIFGQEEPDELRVSMGLTYTLTTSGLKDFLILEKMYADFKKDLDFRPTAVRALLTPHQLAVPGAIYSARKRICKIGLKYMQEIEKAGEGSSELDRHIWSGFQDVKGFVERHFADPVNVLKFQALVNSSLATSQVTRRYLN